MEITVVVTDQRQLRADPAADLRYWRSPPIEERFAAVEQLRQHYITQHFDVEPRLQRVCRVARLERR